MSIIDEIYNKYISNNLLEFNEEKEELDDYYRIIELCKHPILKDNSFYFTIPKISHIFLGILKSPQIVSVKFVFRNILGHENIIDAWECNNIFTPFGKAFPIGILEKGNTISAIIKYNDDSIVPPIKALYAYLSENNLFKLADKLLFKLNKNISVISGNIKIK